MYLFSYSVVCFTVFNKWRLCWKEPFVCPLFEELQHLQHVYSHSVHLLEQILMNSLHFNSYSRTLYEHVLPWGLSVRFIRQTDGEQNKVLLSVQFQKYIYILHHYCLSSVQTLSLKVMNKTFQLYSNWDRGGGSIQLLE